MKKRTVAVFALLGAVALGVIPATTAFATSANVSGQVNAANILYNGSNFRYHAGGGASMYNMNYQEACVSGSGFQCNFLFLGLRNTAGTQITASGVIFDSATVTGPRTQSFTLPSGSTSIPAAYYAFNWKARSDSSGPFPFTWTGTFNY